MCCRERRRLPDWLVSSGVWCGLVRGSLQSLGEGSWIEPTSSHPQNCSRKVLPVSQAVKVGWAIPWIPLAASAGHCWRPVVWRRSLTLFSQVHTLKTLAHTQLCWPDSALPGPRPVLEVRGLRVGTL